MIAAGGMCFLPFLVGAGGVNGSFQINTDYLSRMRFILQRDKQLEERAYILNPDTGVETGEYMNLVAYNDGIYYLNHAADGSNHTIWEAALKSDLFKYKVINSSIEITESDKKSDGSISSYEKSVSLSGFNGYPDDVKTTIIFSVKACYSGSKSGDARIYDNNIVLFTNTTGTFQVNGYLIYV